MADIFSLDLKATNYGLHINSNKRNLEALVSGSNTKEYLGFYVGTVGGTWTVRPIDGKAGITFTPEANTYYPYHVSFINRNASGTGFGVRPDRKTYIGNIVDDIGDMTFSGSDYTTTNDILTVAVGGSATLTSNSAIIPLVGADYNYRIVCSSYTSAAVAFITFGGSNLWLGGTHGISTRTGTITASAVNPLAIAISTPATTSVVIDEIYIERA